MTRRALSDEELARRGLSRHTALRLDRRGRFFDGDQPVAHPGVARAFARWLDRLDDGRYVLRNAIHYVYVTVEGAPLHAVGARVEPGPAVTLLLSSGQREPLRPGSLRVDADGTVYASGRDGTWPIRLAPAAVLALGDLLEDDGDGVAIRLGSQRWPIPARADALG